MDIPGIDMWGDNTPMKVTVAGKALTPTLKNFQSDRPFHLDRTYAVRIFRVGDLSC